MSELQSKVAIKEHTPIKDLGYIKHRINSLVAPLAKSDTYVQQRQQGISHVDALSSTLRNEARATENASDYNLLVATEQLGRFIEATSELNNIRNTINYEFRRPNNDEKKYINWLKEEQIIPFNHTIKEIINTDSSFTIGGLSGALTQTYVGLYGRHKVLSESIGYEINSSEVMKELRNIIDGMRHEVAAETLLAAANIDYDYEVSATEDRTGVDLFVIIDGQRHSIDIKRSQMAEARVLEKHPHSHAVWTGLKEKDFTGAKGDKTSSLTIPFETARIKSAAFVDRIRTRLNLSSKLGRAASRY